MANIFQDIQQALVGGFSGEVSTNPIPVKKNAKPVDVIYNDPNALINEIVNKANQTDPTATNTVFPQAISPLTNAVVGATGTLPDQYSATAFAQDFGGGIGALTSEIDPKTRRAYIAQTDTDGVKHEVAIIGNPDDPTQYQILDKATAVQLIINQYKAKPGGIQALKNELFDRKILKGNTGKASLLAKDKVDGGLVAALLTGVDNLTASNFNNSANKQFDSLSSYLSGTQGLAGTRTSMNYSYTPKDIAAQDITAFIQKELGRGATAKEVADYTSALQTFEREHPQKSVVTTDRLGLEKNRVTYTGASDADKMSVKVAVLAKALTAKGVNPASISEQGGAIAQGMDLLKQTAGAYGLVGYDDAKALNTMIGTLKPGGDIKAEQEKMKQVAKVTYKNLASSLDQGLTVKDVADQYAYYNQKILEKPGVTDVFDPYIQKALHNDGKSGLMSTNDYVTYLKNQPEWAKTQNAREEAAGYANTILKQFGLIA